ncbi:MAG: tetratricopeptide repeat protein [Gammaproteobacteria bacterium]
MPTQRSLHALPPIGHPIDGRFTEAGHTQGCITQGHITPDRSTRTAWLMGLLLSMLLVSGYAMASERDLEQARYQFSRGEHDRALSALKRIPPNSPDFVSGRLLRGVILAEMGRLDEAITSFELLAREYPDLPQPLNNLAVIYAERGMTEQARSTLVRAIELQPRHANAHANLGDLYIHMAVESYARASELAPENISVAAKLRRAGRLLDDPEESAVAANTTRDAAPATPSAQGPAPVIEAQPAAVVPAHSAASAPGGQDPAPATPLETIARLFPPLAGRVTPKPAAHPARPIAAPSSTLNTQDSAPNAQAPEPSPEEPPTVETGANQPSSRPVRLPAADAPAKAPVQASAPSAQATAAPGYATDRCLAIGPFDDSKARIEASTWLSGQRVRTVPFWNERSIGTIYQVYLPPEGTETKARDRLRELRERKVRDAVIIRTGVLRTGISLGAFREEERALRHIETLGRQGVRARYRTQNPVHKQRWLLLRSEMEPATDAALARRYSGLSRELRACDL